MVRTKIEVNILSLKHNSRVMNIIIGSTTTTKDVLTKVLEKCRVRDSLDNYQLWATAKDKSQEGNVSSHIHSAVHSCLNDIHYQLHADMFMQEHLYTQIAKCTVAIHSGLPNSKQFTELILS